MPKKNDSTEREHDETEEQQTGEPPETAEHPVPGIKHEKEPDAENMMPVEDGPGTF
jgi:hypothetical protein